MDDLSRVKQCKYCQSDMPISAKVCPQCRRKQTSSLVTAIKTVVIVVVAINVVFFVLGVIGGILYPSFKKYANKQEKVGEVASDSGDTQSDYVPNEESSETIQSFVVGDIIETGDLKITYENAEPYVSDNEFTQPDEGNIYYKMDFEVENISETDQYVSSYDFTCYADGYDMEQMYFDSMDLDADLSPGKKTKGSVFFEIPENSQSIELEYSPVYNTKVTFIVK